MRGSLSTGYIKKGLWINKASLALSHEGIGIVPVKVCNKVIVGKRNQAVYSNDGGNMEVAAG